MVALWATACALVTAGLVSAWAAGDAMGIDSPDARLVRREKRKRSKVKVIDTVVAQIQSQGDVVSTEMSGSNANGDLQRDTTKVAVDSHDARLIRSAKRKRGKVKLTDTVVAQIQSQGDVVSPEMSGSNGDGGLQTDTTQVASPFGMGQISGDGSSSEQSEEENVMKNVPHAESEAIVDETIVDASGMLTQTHGATTTFAQDPYQATVTVDNDALTEGPKRKRRKRGNRKNGLPKTARRFKNGVSAETLERIFDEADENSDGKLTEVESDHLSVKFGMRSDFDWHSYSGEEETLDFDQFREAANARVKLGPPQLCDSSMVYHECTMLNGDTAEYWNTKADANKAVGHVKELAELLSTPEAGVQAFLKRIGVTNVETNRDALERGAFAFKCQDLCERIVQDIPDDKRPPFAEVGCRETPKHGKKCDVDMSRIGQELTLSASDRLSPADVAEAEKAEANEGPRSHTKPPAAEPWKGHDEFSLRSIIANLFSIYPVVSNPLELGESSLEYSNSSLQELEEVAADARQDLQARLQNARNWCAAGINALNGPQRNRLMTMYFGSTSERTKQIALRALNAFYRDMLNMQLRFFTAVGSCTWCPCRVCPGQNVLAWVCDEKDSRGRPITNICQWLFRFDAATQIRTLVHELAHHPPINTADEKINGCSGVSGNTCYGQKNVEYLAKRSISQALNNAATYGHFTQDAVGVHRRRAAPPTRRRRNPVPRRRRGACFPSTSTALTATRGHRTLQELEDGEFIATAYASDRKIKFERFLGDLHSVFEHTLPQEFLMLSHEFGSLNVSASHFVETLEHGFIPAEVVSVGQHLFVIDRSTNVLRTSSLLSIQKVTLIGRYSPLTFSGSLLVDGVAASSYTMDEAHSFLDQRALQRLIKLLGGYDGVNTAMHYLAFPLRLSFRLGLHKWLDIAVAKGIPGSEYLRRVFASDQQNSVVSKSQDGMPLLVDHLGRFVGAVLNSVLAA